MFKVEGRIQCKTYNRCTYQTGWKCNGKQAKKTSFFSSVDPQQQYQRRLRLTCKLPKQLNIKYLATRHGHHFDYGWLNLNELSLKIFRSDPSTDSVKPIRNFTTSNCWNNQHHSHTNASNNHSGRKRNHRHTSCCHNWGLFGS